MISLRGAGFRYDAGSPLALQGVDIELAAGETLLLAGANGGGKSTLLALLAGLYALTEGELRVAGVRCPGGEAALRRRSGLVLQQADLQILGGTAREDWLLEVEPGDAAGRDRRLQLAQQFGLDGVLDVPVQELSYGQKRKVCLVAVLARRPDVVLLDEPLSGLDYPAVLELRELLAANVRAGQTQVVATHDLEPLADLCHKMAVLEQGRAVLFGSPEEVLPHAASHGVRPPCSWRRSGRIEPWSDQAI